MLTISTFYNILIDSAHQQIKHLVLPKSNQKLIILPNSSQEQTSQSLLTTTTTTTPPNSQTATSPNIMSKLVLYKTPNSTGSIIKTEENGALKIVTSPASQVKPVVLNMNNSKPSVIQNLKPIKIIETSEETQNSLGSSFKRKFQLNNDHSFLNSLSPSSSSTNLGENGGIVVETSQPKLSIINLAKPPNLVCLKLSTPLENHSSNGHVSDEINSSSSSSAVINKRIKLVDVDLNEEPPVQ